MKPFEKFTLKRSRATPQSVKQVRFAHDSLPELVRADSSSISSSSCAGSERSECTIPSSQQSSCAVQPFSSRVTQNIQTKLHHSLQMRRQQRNARQQWLEEKFLKSPIEPLQPQVSTSAEEPASSMSFLPSTLKVKRKLVELRRQQVRNLLATERLMLQQVALSTQ